MISDFVNSRDGLSKYADKGLGFNNVPESFMCLIVLIRVNENKKNTS